MTKIKKDQKDYAKLKISNDKELLQSKQKACPLKQNEKQMKKGMHYNDPKTG